jgi:hypothetical protein
MLERLGGKLAVPAVVLVMVVVEAFALRAHTLGLILLGVACGLALVVIVAGANMGKIAVGAAYACAFTLTWNGWFLGPVRPGDVLILITLVLLLVANPNKAFRTPPWWVKQAAAAIALVALITIFIPPDPVYLASRTVLNAVGKPVLDTTSSLPVANIGVAFKFIVAVFATPIAFAGAVRIDKRAARRLGIAFGAGAALSGWAATADRLGANVSHLITRVPSIAGGRQLGFTNHPNFLAAGTVLGLPFAFWLMASTKRREPLLGAIFLIGLLGGVYSSGSRGGAVCALFILAVCFVLHPRTRGYTPTIALAGIFVVGVVAVVVPAVGHAILVATRLAGGSATQGSDTVRSLVGAQGVRDFTHSPIQGIGLQASFDASEVYLQELASGGLILFAAMQIYLGGAILTAWRNFKRNDMSMAVLGSLLAILVLNFFEADLTDRFYYVPAAILIAMVHTLDADEGSDEDAGGAVAERNPIHAGDPAVPHRQPAHLRR